MVFELSQRPRKENQINRFAQGISTIVPDIEKAVKKKRIDRAMGMEGEERENELNRLAARGDLDPDRSNSLLNRQKFQSERQKFEEAMRIINGSRSSQNFNEVSPEQQRVIQQLQGEQGQSPNNQGQEQLEMLRSLIEQSQSTDGQQGFQGLGSMFNEGGQESFFGQPQPQPQTQPQPQPQQVYQSSNPNGMTDDEWTRLQMIAPKLANSLKQNQKDEQALQQRSLVNERAAETADREERKLAHTIDADREKMKFKEQKEIGPWEKEVSSQEEGALQTMESVSKLNKMVKDGRITGMDQVLNQVSTILGVPKGILLSSDAQLADKMYMEGLKNMTKVFGGRVTNAELNRFMQTIPTSANSPEAILKITDIIYELNEIISRKGEFLREGKKSGLYGFKLKDYVEERSANAMRERLNVWGRENEEEENPIESGTVRIRRGDEFFDVPKDKADQFIKRNGGQVWKE